MLFKISKRKTLRIEITFVTILNAYKYITSISQSICMNSWNTQKLNASKYI